MWVNGRTHLSTVNARDLVIEATTRPMSERVATRVVADTAEEARRGGCPGLSLPDQVVNLVTTRSTSLLLRSGAVLPMGST
jgi:hypothetical protein